MEQPIKCLKVDLCNIYELDIEYTRIFSLVYKILTYKDQENPKPFIKINILRLYSMIQVLFKKEEKLMKKVNFNDFDSHKKLHSQIILSFNNFIKEIHALEEKDIERKLIKNINMLIIPHIKVEDKKIEKFISKNH